MRAVFYIKKFNIDSFFGVKMNRFKFINFLFAFLIILTPFAICFGQQKVGDLKIESYVFENSKKEKVDAEFGKLTVPENRNNPNSRLIELAFVRFKSTSPNPGSPIIYLAGGPGGSGISTAEGSRFPLFMAMREFGDVIALDQRSIGRSTPNLACRRESNLPLDKPATRAEIIAFATGELKKCADKWRSQGVDLASYNTNENADDIESLRQTLGAKKVSLWGISYGTTLGLTIIKRHGQNVDRAILAGVEGLDDALKLPSDVQQHLADIARLVKVDSALNKEIPDFLALVKTVFDRLEKQPVTVEVTDPQTKQKASVVINKYALQLLTASVIGTDSIAAFPRLYYAASKGDYSEIASQWIIAAKYRIGSGSAMSYVTDCSSGASSKCLKRVAREAKNTLLENAADIEFPDVCAAWGNPDLGEKFRASVKSKVPVLLISGTLDGRTPVSNAEAVRRGFSNSTHLIIKGAWHSDPLFLSSPQIKDAMQEFMRGVPVSTTKITLPPLKFAPLKP